MIKCYSILQVEAIYDEKAHKDRSQSLRPGLVDRVFVRLTCVSWIRRRVVCCVALTQCINRSMTCSWLPFFDNVGCIIFCDAAFTSLNKTISAVTKQGHLLRRTHECQQAREGLGQEQLTTPKLQHRVPHERMGQDGVLRTWWRWLHSGYSVVWQ